jgi:hypothetical protein
MEPHLPMNQPGAKRVDDCRVILAILHVLKVGCRWGDRSIGYRPLTTVYNRFNRWSRRGHWLPGEKGYDADRLCLLARDAGATPDLVRAVDSRDASQACCREVAERGKVMQSQQVISGA